MADHRDFQPSADLMRVIAAYDGMLHSIAAFVLTNGGPASLNHLLKSQARSVSDLAREHCGPQEAREILEQIAAGS